MKIVSFLLLLSSYLQLSVSAKPVVLSSPDKNIVFSIDVNNKIVMYTIKYKGKLIIDHSPLSLQFDNSTFKNNLKVNKPVFRDTTEDYDLVVGKTKHVHDEYKQAIIPIQQTTAPYHFINIVVRAFNDGLAFRYEFPKQDGLDSLVLTDEQTTFNFHGDP